MKNKLLAFFRKAVLMVSSVYCTFVFNVNSVYADAFDNVSTVATNLMDKFAGVATAIFPAACVITAVCMFFTRDEKKLATERKLLIGFVAAFIIIQIASKGDFATTFTNIVGTVTNGAE